MARVNDREIGRVEFVGRKRREDLREAVGWIQEPARPVGGHGALRGGDERV